ncbi:hypothetical protein ACW7G0_10960 [Lysobacter sp. A286]
MNQTDTSTSQQTVITCRIPGISTYRNSVRIPLEQGNRIEKTVAAIRVLADQFDGCCIDAVPQYADDAILISVQSREQADGPIDPHQLDAFIRNVAEFLDAIRQGRAPRLDPRLADESESKIPATCKALLGHGTLDLAIEGRPPITLKCQSKSSRDSALPVAQEVHRAEDVVLVSHDHGQFLTSADQAAGLRLGDRITLDDLRTTTQIRRARGILIHGPTTQCQLFPPEPSVDAEETRDVTP